ncbi:hypothetical protein QR680_018308 [Steinernema hermaphroditum]|uniref:Mediator of RNA polymerase II transcription subunit 21 n=1 Tax=Steinernema hermaphroditum TaxID=289476 RepID=A0AA39HJX1_9BILA|nr:hypothetical protein QR680_018308 [Steinernema hermaphroditum]
MGDNLTQIQDLVNDLANLLCNSIGVLQAVAPPVTVGEETEVIQREQQSQHFAHGIAQVTRDIDAVVDSLDLDGAEDRETAEKRIAELEQQRAESVKDLEKVTSQAEAMLEKITSRLGDIAEMDLREELVVLFQACGGQKEPLKESVDELERCLMQFLTHFLQRALNIGKPGKIGLDDIYYFVRRDAVKFQRIRELLLNQERLKYSSSSNANPSEATTL